MGKHRILRKAGGWRALIAGALLGSAPASAEPAAEPPAAGAAPGVPVLSMDGKCAPIGLFLDEMGRAGLVPMAQGQARSERFRLVIVGTPDGANWRLVVLDGALGLACLMQAGTDLELRPIWTDDGDPS